MQTVPVDARALRHVSARKLLRIPKWAERPVSLASLIFLVIVVLVAIFAPTLSPYDPTKPFSDAVLSAPSSAHWLGTDSIGRDVLSRLIWGTRVTVEVGLISVTIALVAGSAVGLLAGFFGGKLDNALMRVMDIMLAIPGILLAMAIVAILGPGLYNAMIAIGIASTPTFARLVRGATLSVKTRDYVLASYCFGARRDRIMLRHILPNIANTMIVFSTLNLGVAILDTAGLSFIGLGAQPPTPDWGSMLNDGKNYLTQAWWLATFPGLAISLVVLAVNLFGDGLRDALDPRGRR